MRRGEDETKDDLTPIIPKIRRAIRQALAEFMDNHATLRHRYTLRTEANILHDLMVAHLRAELDGIPGIDFYLKRNLFLIGVDGKYIIRTKKLDKQLRPSNNVTQQVLDFLNQVQLELPGVEAPTNLHVGYQREGAEVTNSKIWMTCPNGKMVDWALPLDATEEDFGPATAQAPITPITPMPVPVAPAARVRPRAVKDDAKQSDQEAPLPEVADDTAK